MMLLNLLDNPRAGRPRTTGRTHAGPPCQKCGGTEWAIVVSRGHPVMYQYERCATCIRRAAKRRYNSSPRGRSMAARRRNRSKERLAQNERRWRVKNPARTMLIDARKRAGDRGLEFTITLEDVFVPDTCPLLAIDIAVGVGKMTDNSPSLDRIDPTKGYVPGNVWVISWRANRIKSNASLEELKRLVAALEAKCLAGG
jgi:hypothetical protein